MSTTQPNGYLAIPLTGKGTPVLVLHPWWGLNDTIKSFCDRLAAASFVAFAPDLYHGKIATTIPEAETLASTLNGDQARTDVADAVQFLINRAESSGQSLAVIGFSLGAYFALELSNSDPGHIRSVVVFYGTGAEDFSHSKAKYLAHFAENDPYEPAENVDFLQEALQKAGRPATFYSYPGTGHWFFEPDQTDAYDEAAATLAWERTLEFLKQN